MDKNEIPSKDLYTQDGQLISGAMLIEWLQADPIATSLFEGYLNAYKAGLIARQGAETARFSSFKHRPCNDFA